MMRKKGFTIMELLLVVATIAIVAAAVAPTFTEGVAEALEESRKSTMKSAYLNTVFGTNLMMSVLLTNYEKTYKYKNEGNYGKFLPEDLSLDAGNQWRTTGKENLQNFNDARISGLRNLNYYVPIERRLFSNLKGKEFLISAKIGKNQNIIIYYVDLSINKWNANAGIKDYTGSVESPDNKEENHEIMSGNPQAFKSLDAFWEKIKNESPKK